MKITTDNDIIDYVKKVIIHGDMGHSIVLNTYVDFNHWGTSQSKAYKFGDINIDEMNAVFFDLNLNSRISAIYSYFGYESGNEKVCGFDLMVEPFTDGTTNITPKLIEFFNLLVVPYTLSKLKEPFSRDYWTKRSWPEVSFNGVPIAIAPPELNLWERLEAEY
jgi:hypothetical protein